MFTIDSIPDDLVENDDKEQFIKKKIEKKYSELNKLAKTATELEIKLGQMLNTLKEVVRKDGKKWKRYVAKNFPYMSIRTVQRWMKLAKAVDIESHPSLAYVGQTRLLTLANLAKRNKVEVDAFLKDGGVSLNFKKKKKADVGKFRNKVDALIKKHSPKKKVEHTTDAIINRFLKTAKELSKKLIDEEVSESVDKKTLENSIDEVEELLKQLKLIRKRSSSKRKKKKAA